MRAVCCARFRLAEYLATFISALARAIAVSRQADIIAAMSLDCLKGTSRAFDSRIHKLRPHKGQVAVAQRLRTVLHSEFYPSKIAGRSKNMPKVTVTTE